MRIGWIGLGNIGAPMAARIHAAGLPLTVWNRTASRVAPFADLGAATATSATDLADRSEVVFVCIDTPAGLEDVLFGADGVAASAFPPRLVVDTSTMHPEVAFANAARLAETGVAMLDAPVSGGPRGAAEGTLTTFVGGQGADLETARPAMAAYASRITHLGPLGSGQVGKLCNQMIGFATMAAIAEATSMGAAFGLDREALPTALTGGLADSTMLREYIRATDAGEGTGTTGIINGLRALYLGGADAPVGGRVDILLKDLGAAVDVAHRHGSAAPLSGTMQGLYRMLVHHQGVAD
jgi:3-hydroxyisobutyrate dehydrogenase